MSAAQASSTRSALCSSSRITAAVRSAWAPASASAATTRARAWSDPGPRWRCSQGQPRAGPRLGRDPAGQVMGRAVPVERRQRRQTAPHAQAAAPASSQLAAHRSTCTRPAASTPVSRASSQPSQAAIPRRRDVRAARPQPGQPRATRICVPFLERADHGELGPDPAEQLGRHRRRAGRMRQPLEFTGMRPDGSGGALSLTRVIQRVITRSAVRVDRVTRFGLRPHTTATRTERSCYIISSVSVNTAWRLKRSPALCPGQDRHHRPGTRRCARANPPMKMGDLVPRALGFCHGPPDRVHLQVLAWLFVVCDWAVELDLPGDVIRADRAQGG